MTMYLLLTLLALPDQKQALPEVAIQAAATAEQKYTEQAMDVTHKLLTFPTVHKQGLPNADNPHFQGMSIYLKKLAQSFDFEFKDYGAVVVISYGKSPDRLGLVTHGDVVPVDASQWKQSPFSLDRTSEKGKLIGRGVEDDKGPIALALFAMKTLSESQLTLNRSIELIISYTEESSWEPFREFLEKVPPPPINIALDANYPVTVAEKGWSGVWIGFPEKDTSSSGPHIAAFHGGSFLSQVPSQASATLHGVTSALQQRLTAETRRFPDVKFVFKQDGDSLQLSAQGRAAHSSTPTLGTNAITHLAHVLGQVTWRPSPAANAVAFINQHIGLGVFGEKFGDMAYAHSFMGPLTLNLGTVEEKDGLLTLGLNFRSPAGKDKAQLEAEVRKTLASWDKNHPGTAEITQISMGEAHMPENPPHVPVLLNVFSHFTGIENPKARSIGGGTHARLVPNGVNFGPAMPGAVYSGHSEHEFLTEEQFRLNLRMYTAMLVMLATDEGQQ